MVEFLPVLIGVGYMLQALIEMRIYRAIPHADLDKINLVTALVNFSRKCLL